MPFAYLMILSTSLLGGEPMPVPEAEPVVPGVVFVIGGVGGFDFVGQSAQNGFARAGVPHEVVDYVWTHGWGQWMKDLQDRRHLLQKADELAGRIRQLKTESADRPVYLVAKSGGTALALATAERLPSATLERIVLLSAAVSPTYDLIPALQATRREIVSFHSRHDRVVLGWGTREFGTADRVYTPSAGLIGFQIPDALDEQGQALYGKLVQVPWNARMMSQGHLGTHLGTSLPWFLQHEVAPWLLP
jgi:pimeloyl-ACP methyl ester carboxylesterase